jgi:hypothetical protein
LQQGLAGRPKFCALPDNFHRYIAMKDFIVGAVNNAHPAFADLRGNTAMPEHLADHAILLRASC